MGSGSSTCEKDTQDKSDISKSKNESVVTNTCNVDSSSTCGKDTQDKPDISKSKNHSVVTNTVDSSSTCEKATQDKADISKSKNDSVVVTNKVDSRFLRDTIKRLQKTKAWQKEKKKSVRPEVHIKVNV